jgi:hypothetical protein
LLLHIKEEYDSNNGQDDQPIIFSKHITFFRIFYFMEGGYTPEAYYVGTIPDFFEDSRNSWVIPNHLESVHKLLCPDLDPSSIEQKRAWESSIYFLRRLLEEADLNEDQLVVLEPILASTRKRIDVLLLGKDQERNTNAAILELKTWHTRRRKGRRYEIIPRRLSSEDTTISISLFSRTNDTSKEDTESWVLDETPRIQATAYAREMRTLLKASQCAPLPKISSCVVLYNCTKLSQALRAALEYNLPENIVYNVPIFTRDGCDGSLSLSDLAEKIHDKIALGEGEVAYQEILPALHTVKLT